MEAILPESQVEFSADSYVPKLLHDSEKMRVVLFCLEAGQEIPEHTAPSEVLFYVLQGTGTVGIGEEKVAVRPAALAVCPPSIPHSANAQERMVLLAVIAPAP